MFWDLKDDLMLLCVILEMFVGKKIFCYVMVVYILELKINYVVFKIML